VSGPDPAKPTHVPDNIFGAWRIQGESRAILWPNISIDDMRERTIRLKSTHQSEPVNSFSLYKYFIRSGVKNSKTHSNNKRRFLAHETPRGEVAPYCDLTREFMT